MEEKKKAEIIYKKIGRVWCPALNSYIAFTNDGLRHLIRKGGRRRSPHELKRRLSFLPYAKEIMEDVSAVAIYEKRNGVHLTKRHNTTIVAQEHTDFWAITKIYKHIAITVVIRQTKTKEKHFFSIYGARPKNQKTAL